MSAYQAQQGGGALPTSEMAHAANVGRIGGQRAEANECDSRIAPVTREARDYLACLHAEHADSDELALILAALYGAALRGFCHVIAKALGVRHA